MSGVIMWECWCDQVGVSVGSGGFVCHDQVYVCVCSDECVC